MPSQKSTSVAIKLSIAQQREAGDNHPMVVVRWIGAVMILLLAWLTLAMPAIGFVVTCYPEPTLTAPDATFSEVEGQRNFGEASLTRLGTEADGVHLLTLHGDAVTRGWAQGVLVGDYTRRLEVEMQETFTHLVPNFWARHLILGAVGINNATLTRYFQDDELLEIAAESDGADAQWTPRTPHQPHYPHAVQYHALHDISHYLIDNPLINAPQIGCTAIAVNGPRSANGHLLVGRIFDFEGGVAFDRDKVVQHVIPDHGYAYLSVAWPGAVGAVTGLNAEGLWVSLNAADTASRRTVGRPTIMAARQVLQTCATIEEAVAIWRATQVFVSETVVIASARDNRAVAIEIGPSGCAVREMVDSCLVATNHFCDPLWQNDAVNLERQRSGTTTIRFARAQELLDATTAHTPESLLRILQNRQAAHNVDVGFHNRGTINSWIAAHVAVADVQERRIWVCGTWHGLGTAHAISFNGAKPAYDLAASPDKTLHDHNAERWDQLIRTTRALFHAGRITEARASADEAVALNSKHWRSYLLLAEISDQRETQRSFARQAMAALPPYPEDRARVEYYLTLDDVVSSPANSFAP